MIYFTVAASKPGAPNPKLEKRTGDIKTFAIDCSALLVPNELVAGMATVKAPVALDIKKAMCKEGKFIVFEVSGGPTNTPHVDYPVSFSVKTSLSNTLEVPVTIRAYS